MLAQLPAFSAQSLVEGAYITKLERYLQDQFPFREGWVNAQYHLAALQGCGSTTACTWAGTAASWSSWGTATPRPWPTTSMPSTRSAKNRSAGLPDAGALAKRLRPPSCCPITPGAGPARAARRPDAGA